MDSCRFIFYGFFFSELRVAVLLQPPLELEGHINLGAQNDCILTFFSVGFRT